jgi:hypothetical protein
MKVGSILAGLAVCSFLMCGSSAAFAGRCLSSSPTIEEGKNPYAPITVRELTANEQEILERMFKSLSGAWSGGAESFFCRSAENPEDVETDAETARGRIQVDYEGNLAMTLNFHSPGKRTTRQGRLNLFRSSGMLRFDHDKDPGNVEVIEISDAGLAFLYRRVINTGLGSSRREFFLALACGDGTVTIEQKLYIQGRLSSGEVWRLKKE